MRKMMIFSLLLTLVFSGCVHSGAQLEKKYGEEIIVMFEGQTAIPEWREYLKYAENAYKVRKEVSPSDMSLEEKERTHSVDSFQGISASIKFAEKAFTSTSSLKRRGLDLREARERVRVNLVNPGPWSGELYTVIDKVLIAVYAGYTWEMLSPAVKAKFAYFSESDRILALSGKIR